MLIRLIKVVLRISIGLVLFFIIVGFVLTWSYSKIDKEAQETALKDLHCFSDNFFTDSEDNQDCINKIIQSMSLLDSNVLSSFHKEWKVMVSDEIPFYLQLRAPGTEIDLLQRSQNQEVVTEGYTNWHLRLIYVKPNSDPQISANVFLHEIGHFFDFEFGLPSYSERFEYIYSLYKDSFYEKDPHSTDGYATSSSSEFFATVFKEYVLFPDHLLEYAPDAYSFIDTLYKEVSENQDSDITTKYDLRASFSLVKKNLQSS